MAVEFKKGVLQVADIAKAIGWPVDTTRRHLISLKAVQKRGGRYMTTVERLKAAWIEAGEVVEQKMEEDE